jgi:type II secretion system protein G
MNLLLAAAILLQDPSADEAFRKIEESFEKAKSLRLKFKVDVVQKRPQGDTSFALEGAALLKDGNRFRFTAYTKVAQMEEDFLAVSDGTRLFQQSGKAPPARRDAPPNLVPSFKAVTARGGSFLAFAQSLLAGRKEQDPKKDYELLALKQGEDDKEAKTLVYGLQFPDIRFDCTLRYNPKSFLPLGRVILVKQKGADAGSIRETYDEVVVDADIPDETFKLPEEQGDAKIAKAKTDLAILNTALGIYEVDSGKYPTSAQGLVSLLKQPDGAKNWKGPYLQATELPKDPWGNPYVYACPGIRNESGFDLSSNGPDGKPGTEDDIIR